MRDNQELVETMMEGGSVGPEGIRKKKHVGGRRFGNRRRRETPMRLTGGGENGGEIKEKEEKGQQDVTVLKAWFYP